jgi:hypothetical protein
LLGKVLELLPLRLTFIAVEVGRAGGDDGLSGEVLGALPAVLRCFEACVTDEKSVLDATAGAWR